MKNLIASSLLLTSMLACRGSAQETPATTPAALAASLAFSSNGQELNNQPGRNVALADFNGDGVLDAFIVNRADYRVYFGDGHGRFAESEHPLEGPDRWCTPCAVDLDGNGPIDVLTGRTAWINDGRGNFTARLGAVQSEETGEISGPLADLNGDGRPDLFAYVRFAAWRVYFNDVQGNLRDSGQRLGDGAIGKGQAPMTALGDIDGDGDIDAITAGWRWDGSTECPNLVWINDGRGTFRQSDQLLDEGASHVHGIALGDVNGDGALDLVLGIQDRNRGGRVYLNDGKGTFTGGQNLAGVGANNIALADFDGDGDLDVFITCSRAQNVVCLGDGKGGFVDSGLRLGPEKDTWSWDVGAGDFNGDGRIDAFVVTCSTRNQGPVPSQVWINTPPTAGK